MSDSNPFDGTSAQTELKRAYMLIEYEAWDEAIDACDRAIDRADGDPLPLALKGSILSACGEFASAMKVLRPLTRDHSDFVLGHLFLVETLFLSGKIPQGKKALSRAKELDGASNHQEFIELLETCFVSG